VDASPSQEQAGAPASAPHVETGSAAAAVPAALEWAPDETLAAGLADRPARRLTRRRAAVGALVVVAGAIAALVALGGGSAGRRPATTGVPAGDTTATVSRRTLTESASVDGTLGYGTPMELYDRLSGTFTWLPSAGATIGRGGTLFRVDNLPVVLMYGTLPAYRALKQGVSAGPDVAELNRNLIDLGYDPDGAIGDVEDFGAATAAAVRRWQKAEGLEETGEVELGRVIFAPSARRVTTVHVTLGQDPAPAKESGPGGNEGDAHEPRGAAAEPKEEPAAGGDGEAKEPKGKKPKAKKPKGKEPKDKAPTGEEPKDKAPTGEEPKDKAPTAKAPKAKKAETPQGSTGDGSKEPEGSSKEPSGSTGAAQAELVLTTTSTQQLVQLKLKAEQQQLAHVGELVPVQLPGGGVVRGRIVEVGTVASEASGAQGEKGEKGAGEEGSGESTIPVTLALTRHVRHLDEAPVSVELVKSVRRHVLAVPATALFATAGDRYAIEILEGDRRVEVPVTTGMFADGYVQVEGAGLHEGQTVIEAE
jgi:peptidoglycan hydrolase-like protein with peptidoglycan-binding domain